LIQLLLGMPLDLVMQDYLLSNDYLREFKVEMLKRLKVFSYFGISPQKFYPLLEARKEYLEAAFNQIRNDYGTVDDYAREGLGFSDEDRLRLNQALLSRVVFS
jgi:protein-tyrosine phosphatase